MMTHYVEVWRFATANHTVIFSATPECDSPEDHFDDSTVVDAINSGDLAWFTARVTVEKHGIEVGSDYLGCCAYARYLDFCTGANRGGYFRDMVGEAIANARANLARLCTGRRVTA